MGQKRIGSDVSLAKTVWLAEQPIALILMTAY